jgi:hypothetical protein
MVCWSTPSRDKFWIKRRANDTQWRWRTRKPPTESNNRQTVAKFDRWSNYIYVLLSSPPLTCWKNYMEEWHGERERERGILKRPLLRAARREKRKQLCALYNVHTIACMCIKKFAGVHVSYTIPHLVQYSIYKYLKRNRMPWRRTFI